jgi:hypothetical protein
MKLKKIRIDKPREVPPFKNAKPLVLSLLSILQIKIEIGGILAI